MQSEDGSPVVLVGIKCLWPIRPTPKRRSRLTPGERSRLMKAVSHNHLDMREICAAFNVSETAVRRYWRKARFG